MLRTKPSKLCHVILWDTDTDECIHGSWFRGRIDPTRCDLSWDGEWMVYVARGYEQRRWTGICRPPRLRTIVDTSDVHRWGGGFFVAGTMLYVDEDWNDPAPRPELPFAIEDLRPSRGEAFTVLMHRLERDGWTRKGEFGEMRRGAKGANICVGDPGWQSVEKLLSRRESEISRPVLPAKRSR
ncbi:MAG: hypothetical protein KDC38_19615, partial [Planctomycetes bacterium]|nr:hypothetical protein [Planctomycetota bacterium]